MAAMFCGHGSLAWINVYLLIDSHDDGGSLGDVG